MWPFSLFFTPKWKVISKEKREARNALIQVAKSGLSAEATTAGDKYTRASASEIVENIQQGKWTAVQVLQAYISRAILVHEQTNCITEVMFTTALEEAKQLDEEYKATGQLRGPLHGVPISFKDQFEIAGKDASIGFSSWCHNPCENDAALVKLVRKAGAIPVCKGNVPQTMLIFECSNPVWGTTVNPWNHGFTCGGSSGGEGVLLSTSSVALGIGSDVGGSLRIPSLYCGLYTIKPCVKRITAVGARSANPGFDSIIATLGPMARSVADVELLSKVIIGATPGNTHEGLPPVPYRDFTLPPRPLKFGYYLDDNWIKTSPANRRAVMMTVEALRKEGHEVSEFILPNGPKALKIFTGLSSADGYDTILSPRHVNGDPAESNLFILRLGPRLFGWVHSLVVFIGKYFLGDQLAAEVFSNARKKGLKEYWALSKDKYDLVKEFYEKVWYKHDFDAIIGPGMAIPALPHGAIKTVAHLANGTLYFNVVDSPVGVIPVTRVDPALDSLTEEWWNDPKGHGTKLFEADIYKGGIYDPIKMKGLPLGIQIVGRNWEDEKVISIMHVVDKALGPRGFGPGAWEDFQKAKQPVA